MSPQTLRTEISYNKNLSHYRVDTFIRVVGEYARVGTSKGVYLRITLSYDTKTGTDSTVLCTLQVVLTIYFEDDILLRGVVKQTFSFVEYIGPEVPFVC